jgi:hypothetical protein
MVTASGKVVPLRDVRAEHICGEDIAHHLAGINRFASATRIPVSVAAHSIAVANLVKPEHRFPALLHDGHEAYQGDQIRPLRYLLKELGCNLVDRIAKNIQDAVHQAFNIQVSEEGAKDIHRADMQVCRYEAQRFMADQGKDWDWSGIEMPSSDLMGPIDAEWTWEEARYAFLLEMKKLGGAETALLSLPEPPAGDAGFFEILREIRDLHVQKSSDYGRDSDPLFNLRFGAQSTGLPLWLPAWLRCLDKVVRINMYCQRGHLACESVDDSLKDLSALSALALRLHREEQARQIPE